MYLEEEAIFDKNNKNPVYIVLMNGKSPLAKLILTATGDYYSHACIAFDSSLDPLYSFGSKSKITQDGKMGLSISKPSDLSVFKQQAYYSVYVTYVTDEVYAKMKERLQYFLDNQNKLKYDFVGLLNIWVGKSSESHTTKYFCSRFVMDIIGAGTHIDKLPSLYRPQDLTNMDNITLVNRGYDLHNYDKKITDRNEKLLKKGKLNTDDIIFENMSSTLEKDYQSKHDMKLSDFVKMKLTDAIIQVYKSRYSSLSHIRINKDTNGYAWIDKKNDLLVAIVNAEEKDDGFTWVQAFEIFAPYKGHGLSKSILDTAIRDLKATNLSVNKDNQVAIKIYKSYGFKTYKTTESMYFMSIDKDAFTDDEDDIEESTILESSNNRSLYFVSQNDMDGKLLTPRVPNNYFTKNGYEDSKTPRVCFAPSIDKCLMALSQKCSDMELYIHTPESGQQLDVHKPTIDEVPDCAITGEIWVKNKVRMKCIGKIKVVKDKGLPGHKFSYGSGKDKKEAELYDWEWKWVEHIEEGTIEIDGETGFYDRHNRWNPILIIDGENYRHRVECLIMCQNKLFVATDNNGKLIIPGGGVDKSLSDEEQVYNECKEEARILVKDIKNTGYSYLETNGTSKFASDLPKEQQWGGAYNEVYIANYMKDFTGFIDYCDRDEQMIRGRFRHIGDILDGLKDEWKAALIDAGYISPSNEATKFFKDPKLALKRKLGIKKNNMIKLGDYSDSIPSAPPAPKAQTAAPTRPTNSDTTDDDSTNENTENIPNNVKASANRLLCKEIAAYPKYSGNYFNIDYPLSSGDGHAIVGWKMSGVDYHDFDGFNKVRDSIYEHCSKIFSDINPDYEMNINLRSNCIYISER